MNKNINLGERILEIFIDLVVLAITLFIIFVVSNLFKSIYVLTFLMSLIIFLYLSKDSFHGQSPAKRILKMKIVRYPSNKSASPIQLVLRNLFIIIWPIELVFILINPSRRLGDLVAGTKLAYVQELSSLETRKYSLFNYCIAYSIVLAMVLIILTPVILNKEMGFNSERNSIERNEIELKLRNELSSITGEIKRHQIIVAKEHSGKYSIGIFIPLADTNYFVNENIAYLKDSIFIEKIQKVMDTIPFHGEITFLNTSNKKFRNRSVKLGE